MPSRTARSEGHPGAAAPAVALTLAALLVVGVTGCGGDDDPAAEPPASSPAGATPEPTDPGSTAPVADHELFLPVDDAPSPTGNTYAKRARVVELNTDLLTTGGGPTEVTLTPFPDLSYTTSLTYTETGGIEQWTGKLVGVRKSTVVIVAVEGVYNLHVSSPEGAFEMTATGAGGSYVVSELDPDAFPSEGHVTPSGG